MKTDCCQSEEKSNSISTRKRKRGEKGAYTIRRHALGGKFDPCVDDKMDVDIDTKRAALKASPSIVSLVSYNGRKRMFVGSGTIIGCEEVNGTHTSTILTSTALLGSSTESNAIQDDIKVNVYLPAGKLFDGRVSGYDFHFNIATIDITSDEAMPTAALRLLDDSISIFPSKVTCPNEVASKSFQLSGHSNLYKLHPGDMVVAIGRSCGKTHHLMAAPGKFSRDSYKSDDRQLFKSTCTISTCGFGGPLVNCYGEVIGVNLYDNTCTSFLPVNIVSKCLRRFKANQKSGQPWLGMELKNLYAASVGKLEKAILKFNISRGLLVKEVITGSPAEQAGILYGDVIVQCGKKDVQSLLEFYDIIWEKVGNTVEVVVIRESSAACLTLTVFVDEISPDKANRVQQQEQCGRYSSSSRSRKRSI